MSPGDIVRVKVDYAFTRCMFSFHHTVAKWPYHLTLEGNGWPESLFLVVSRSPNAMVVLGSETGRAFTVVAPGECRCARSSWEDGLERVI